VAIGNAGWRAAVFEFMAERAQHLLERRGFKAEEIRAVTPELAVTLNPYEVSRRAEALAQARKTPGFESLASLFKRVKNITRDFKPTDTTPSGWAGIRAVLKEPSELALLTELERRWTNIGKALEQKQYLEAMNQLAPLHAPVNTFFEDVLVMADDPKVRDARLALLATLRDTVMQTGGDISEIAPEDAKQV
jgi:glycyl-tRNA synthetase beta chain